MKKLVLIVGVIILQVSIVTASENIQPPKIVDEGRNYIFDEYFKDYEKKINADINGDGKDELIWSYTATSDDDVGMHLCATLIYEINGDEKKLVKTILNGEHPKKLYAVDFDNDGAKEFVLMTNAGMHWTEVNVYQYKDNDYVSIFSDETASGVVFVEDTKQPLIKVGRPGGKANWSYADEPLWKVYKWGEKGFEISKDLSSPKLKYYYPEDLEEK